jgi:NAD(P)-dependent dehydrogenase (short-subunit alcohol dehydrogenase family)
MGLGPDAGVNLKGPFLLLQSVGAWMAEHAGGSVVNIASIAPGPRTERAAYVVDRAHRTHAQAARIGRIPYPGQRRLPGRD